jgi:hypothetical protein
MAKAARRPATRAWGTPDPRDGDAYPQVASTSPQQWAWEFLRRRSDYRVRWDQKVRPFLSAGGEWDLAAADQAHEDAVKRGLQAGRSFEVVPPLAALGREFGVHSPSLELLDPRNSLFPLFDVMGSVAEVLLAARRVVLPEVLISFNVTLPLDHQLKTARSLLDAKLAKWLRNTGRESPPQRPAKLQLDKFPRYLRLLDFEDADTPDREIGQHLFPNYSGEKLRDQIRKASAAAHRWQDDYLLIAMHSPAPS